MTAGAHRGRGGALSRSTALLDRRRHVSAGRHRRRRTVLLSALAVLACVTGAWWLATGPLLAVTSVNVSGYRGPDQPSLVRTVQFAARSGTMLKLPTVAVREALIRRHPWVADVAVHHNWPRGIDVRITPATPVAVALTTTGRRLLVAESGRILGEDMRGADLPRYRMPDARVGEWVTGPARRAPFDLLMAMTPETARRISDLRVEGGVVRARITGGPELRLGPPTGMVAKGRAVEAVLGKESLAGAIAGADYLDVSAPGQPTLGGLPVDENAAEQPSSESQASG